MKKFRMDPFLSDTPSSYPSRDVEELLDAILSLHTRDEAAKFSRDLLTMAEITEFANRWQVVKLLVKGKSYAEIAQELKTSTTTITRVAHWLHAGMGGYKLIADRLWKPLRDDRPKKPRMFGKRRFVPSY